MENHELESLTVPMQADAPRRAGLDWRDLEIVPDEKPLRAAPRRAHADPEPCPLWQFVAIVAGFGLAVVSIFGALGWALGAWS